MSAGKTISLVGLLAKNEASYGAGGSLSASTDAIQLAPGDPATYAITYVFDGGRDSGNGSTGLQRGTVPKGRTAQLTARVEVKGAGAAYNADSVKSQDLHAMLLACGYSAARDATGGSEKWTFTPQSGPTGFASLVAQMYARGEVRNATHGLGNVVISRDGLGPAIAEFTFDMLDDLSAVADAAVPAITYPLHTIMPIVDHSTLTIGSWAAGSTGPIVRSWSFDAGRARAPRVNLAAAALHAGWTMGKRTPSFTAVVETAALAGSPYHGATGLDPERLRDAGTTVAVTLTHGQTQYNRLVLGFAQAQLVGVEPDADEQTALTRLTFRPVISTPQANDDHTIVLS